MLASVVDTRKENEDRKSMHHERKLRVKYMKTKHLKKEN